MGLRSVLEEGRCAVKTETHHQTVTPGMWLTTVSSFRMYVYDPRVYREYNTHDVKWLEIGSTVLVVSCDVREDGLTPYSCIIVGGNVFYAATFRLEDYAYEHGQLTP